MDSQKWKTPLFLSQKVYFVSDDKENYELKNPQQGMTKTF